MTKIARIAYVGLDMEKEQTVASLFEHIFKHKRTSAYVLDGATFECFQVLELEDGNEVLIIDICSYADGRILYSLSDYQRLLGPNTSVCDKLTRDFWLDDPSLKSLVKERKINT